MGPLMIAAGFVGLFATIASGPVAAIAVSVALVGGGIGTCWAHVGSIVLGSARQGRREEAMTASLIPTTQAFAVSMGAALSGIIANAAGLSGGDARAVPGSECMPEEDHRAAPGTRGGRVGSVKRSRG